MDRRRPRRTEALIETVGAVRALHMLGPTIRERITAFEPPTELVSGPPFRDDKGEITIEPCGDISVISTADSFPTILPGTQFLMAIAIHIVGAGVARVGRRRARSDMLDG